MTTSLVGKRTPVAIDDGLIRAGSQTAAFDRAQPETLLRNYLRLIRRARSQQRAPEISLRREDVEALADFLGVTAESVLHRLATLMGSSRTQRNTVLAAFASGALLIGLSGSVAATSPLLDDTAPIGRDAAVAAALVDDELADDMADMLAGAVLAAGRTEPTEPETQSTATTPASVAPDGSSPRRSTVVVGDTGADRTPSTFPQLVESPPTAVGESANGRPASVQPATQVDDDVPTADVALVSPVVPDVTDDVAVGDAVVPTSTPTASDSGVDDGSEPVGSPVTETTIGPPEDIPQELPPVGDETVAVGPPPVPPTVPTTTTTVPATTTTTTVPPTTTTTTVPPTTTTTTIPTTTAPPTTGPVEPIP